MTESLTPAQAHERALALHMGGSLAEAESVYRLILDAAPDFGPSWMALGVLMGQVGRYHDSSAFLTKAVRLMPESSDSWSNLGNVLRILDRHEESAEACHRAVTLDPKHSFAWANLSGALRMTGRVEEALSAARTSLRLAPGFQDGIINEACALQSLGRMEEALCSFQSLVEGPSPSLYAWSCCLMALQYSDRHSPSDIKGLVDRFYSSQPVPPRRRKVAQVRKIGLLSGDFVDHAVGTFCQPLVQEWDHRRHELHVITTFSGEDHVTRQLREGADGWHDISGLSDEAAESLILSLQLDLLVDLSGHTSRNRLAVVMRKPAPLVASYLGFSASGGIRSVDVLFGDPWVTPKEHEPFYTERVMRLPSSVFSRPMRKGIRLSGNRGGRRFGSFNNPAKMSLSCLDLWAELLRQEEDSVLVLKYRGFGDQEVQASFARELERRGVQPERLEFHSWMSKSEHRALISSLDLHLDTQPYTGATTIADMLEEGVPCPSLAGDRYAARMGASVLSACGLPQLIASSPEEWLMLCHRTLHDEAFRAELDVAFSRMHLSDFSRGEVLAKGFQDLCDQAPLAAAGSLGQCP